MAGKLNKPEEMVVKLREVEVLQGQGMSVADAVLRIGPIDVVSNDRCRGDAWHGSTSVGDPTSFAVSILPHDTR